MSNHYYNINFSDSSDELYHHGIMGQKWGVRKWQNDDGSLTSAGRIHYGVGTSDGKSEYRKKKEKKYLLEGMNEEKAAMKAKRMDDIHETALFAPRMATKVAKGAMVGAKKSAKVLPYVAATLFISDYLGMPLSDMAGVAAYRSLRWADYAVKELLSGGVRL